MVNQDTLFIYVEGGGDGHALRGQCRNAFATLTKRMLQDHHIERKNPKYVACGSRNEAFDMFCTALSQSKPCLLLIDSEAPVTAKSPWEHLRNRANDSSWQKPQGATDEHCHFMVQCMEAWFLADKCALAKYYGKNFNVDKFPSAQSGIENIDKQKILTTLQSESSRTTKGRYDKGGHSFDILAMLAPAKIEEASGWAKRFFEALRSYKS